LSSIASTYCFCPRVFGRIALPRAVMIAWLSTSVGAPPPSRMRREVATSPGSRSTPLRTSSTSSPTSRSAAPTCSAGPSRVTTLPRTSTSTSGYWCSSVVSRRSCGPSSRTIATPSTSSSACACPAPAVPAGSCPSDKRAFRESAHEHVRVHVEHRLAGVRARVEHETEVAVGVLLGETLRDRDDVLQQLGVGRGEAHHIRVLRRLRHDEQVDGGLRLDVVQGDDALVFVHDVGGDLARDDPLEDRRGFRHAPHPTERARPRSGPAPHPRRAARGAFHSAREKRMRSASGRTPYAAKNSAAAPRAPRSTCATQHPSAPSRVSTGGASPSSARTA